MGICFELGACFVNNEFYAMSLDTALLGFCS